MKRIIRELKTRGDFLLICHVSPDGDTLGSAAALALALWDMGKNVCVAVDGTVPHKLRFLRESVRFYAPDELPDRDFECAIAIDTATVRRLSALKERFFAAKSTINIDHHITNEKYAEFNYIRERAATGEIILELIEKMKRRLTPQIADALYCAISTDTHNFVYSNVTKETFMAAAKLTKSGARIAYLCDMIYYERTEGATRLIARGIENLKLYSEGRISMMTMTLAEIASCGAKREDCEVLVNYAREIEGVGIAVFFNETPEGFYKVSLRSNGDIDISDIAASYGGGGHMCASGFTHSGDPESFFKEELLSVLEGKLK